MIESARARYIRDGVAPIELAVRPSIDGPADRYPMSREAAMDLLASLTSSLRLADEDAR